MTSSAVPDAGTCASLTDSRAALDQPSSTLEHSLIFLAHFFLLESTAVMDFRSLDRMGDSDEAILEEPYRPFYNIFASKPVLVKQ